MREKDASGRSTPRRRLFAGLVFCLLLAAIAALPAAGGSAKLGSATGQDAWHRISGKPAPAKAGAKPQLKLSQYRSFKLDQAALKSRLAKSWSSTKGQTVIVSLPAPNGTFQRFALSKSAIMAPGLAAKHPDISTYYGHGIDDPGASIAADLSHIGFHASVRSPHGAWYIDPLFRDKSAYASYYGANLSRYSTAPFVERESSSAELSVDKGYYHPTDTVNINGDGFAEDASISIDISDPEGKFATRTLTAHTDGSGAFKKSFTADPNGHLDTHIVEASDGHATASNSYQVTSADDNTKDPPTGDVLRTYRLALITDPSYSTFSGGPANVTAAKVALMNRVVQVYHDDMSISMQLIANNDQLNLNDWASAIAPNGPCGAAGCFALSNLTGCSSLARNRIVAGQVVGAESFDIGHLALGAPGGGVANLGVIGRAAKAQGCTGIPTPVGDFYAIDYVAHEMGHQFSGNHPFNGNQLNCSGGNRNAATSTEPGSGSSIMAYAGICLTDDLQPHSDPYFSERSLQEITTYTSSNQAAINEVQEVALRHFGGGNEVQVATFATGFAPTATIQPLTVAIGAVPSSTQLGGLDETGNTVTVATGAAGATHTLQPGDVVTISGASNAGYNGTFTVNTVPGTRAFTYTNPTAGLPRSGGGTITLVAPGLSESGNTVTVRTVAAHGRSVGDVITIAGAGVAAYNGTWTIDSVPTSRSFTLTNPTAGLANSGAGTMTFISPFNLRIGGSDSPLVNSANYTNAGLTAAFAAIPGFAGTATVTGTATTGFTVTYTGAAANTDVPSFQIVNLSCGGCFSSVEETNHGGTFDSFTLGFGANTSAPIVNGTNYTSAGLTAALAPILPAGTTVTLTAFGGGNISGLNNQGFGVSFGGTQAATNVADLLQVTNATAGTSGFANVLDKGGAVDNKGTVTSTGNQFATVNAGSDYTIPLRTPFALTGSANDPDDAANTLLYSWEQNDRGGTAGAALMNNTKVDGPLFAMFGTSAPISESDTLQYNSPNENHLTTNPTRVFPEMRNILANNTNADTGACTTGPIAPPVPIPIRECFMDFLPTSSYTGSTAGGNAAPPRLNFRFTARDGKGGTNADDIVLTLAAGTGPFLVTSNPASVPGAQASTVTWDVAGTDANGINTANVKISLSTDGGQTFPTVLAASTPNDGSQSVTFPNTTTSTARVKVEAIGNVFFDVNNTNFAIAQDTTPPVTTATLSPAAPTGANGWYLGPVQVTLSATDSESGVASTSYTIDGGATQTYTGPFTISTEGAHVVAFWSTDNGGNVESQKTQAVKIDLNTPTSSASISPAPQNGWYASPTVTLTGADGAGSGIDHISYKIDGAGPFLTYTGPLSGFSTGNHFVQFFATDVAGRVESTVNLIAFKADSVKPTVNVTRPAEGSSYPLDKVVTAAYKCTDNQSGMASCVGTVANGANLDTSTIGTHTFTVTGTDKAGNVTVVTTHYTVTYTFNGFFAPIGNQADSSLNLVHAGDLIKVGFGLNGDRGLSVGTFTSASVACPSWTPHSVPAAGAGTTAGLAYGVASGHYTYGWQTSAAWAGSCREFTLTLNDGSVHKATFMFFA